jgi:hypothetical protein
MSASVHSTASHVRRNRRFFSFHRPHRCRGCGTVLDQGSAGDWHLPRTREVHRIRNQSSHACPSCLGISELTLDDYGAAEPELSADRDPRGEAA